MATGATALTKKKLTSLPQSRHDPIHTADGTGFRAEDDEHSLLRRIRYPGSATFSKLAVAQRM